MDFSLSEERKMLQETVARFFENNYKDIKKRSDFLALNDGFSREIWKESADLGVISGLISPTFGGLGGTGEDISIIFELIGKSLCIEPFLSSKPKEQTQRAMLIFPQLGAAMVVAKHVKALQASFRQALRLD